MPADDLSSISGLQDKHVRVLDRLQVTDLRGLVHADQDVIYRAMANLRPRPTLEQIGRWQEEARSSLEQAVTDSSDWHTAASFVLVFSQRQVGDAWERRIEAERTEVEPEQDHQVWPGWDCGPVCGWMLGQLEQPGRSEAQAPPAEEPAGAAVPAAGERSAGRARLRIESASIIDATGPADVVVAGVVVANPPTELVAPVRVVFTVSGARPGTRLQAVVRIVRRDQPGWNPQNPVTISEDGQAEFDLTAVPAGEHEMALIAWAADATAGLVSLRLPKLMIRTGPI